MPPEAGRLCETERDLGSAMKAFMYSAALLLIAAQGAVAQAVSPESADRSPIREHHAARTVQALVGRQAATIQRAQPVRSGVVRLLDDTEFGAISGHVHGLQPDPAGVMDAMVWAFRLEDETGDSTFAVSNSIKDDGYYLIGGLKPGLYVVAVRASGFGTQFYDHAETASDAKPIEVTGGVTVMDIDFFLEPWVPGSGAITGVVIDAVSNAPVPGAELFAFPADGGWASGWGRSDENGRYFVTGLPSGSYYIEARAQNFIPQFYDGARFLDEATTIAVADADTVEHIDFALLEGGRIAGRVTGKDGSPLAGVTVTAYIPYRFEDSTGVVTKPSGFGYGATDEEGRYVLRGLESGDYVVAALSNNPFYFTRVYFDGVATEDEATLVAVTEGEETAGIDLLLDLPDDLGSLSGSVLDSDGKPIADAMVWIFSDTLWGSDSTAVPVGDDGSVEPGTPDFPVTPGTPIVSVQVPVDPTGAFRIDGIPAGPYLVAAEVHTREYGFWIWYPSSMTRDGAKVVTVEGDRETSGVDIVVPGFDGFITGKVTNASGDPLAGATVWIQPESFADGSYRYSTIEQVAVADSSGMYLFRGIPDGGYRLVASACGAMECVRRWWPEAQVPEEADVVRVSEGKAVQGSIDFVLPLREGSGSILGTIYTQDGNPLFQARVAAFAVGPDGVLWTGLSTMADEKGRYDLKGLFEGEWLIHAEYFDGDRMGSVWYDGASSMETATPVRLGANERRDDVDLTMEVRPILGGIRGRVSYDDLDVVINRGYVEIRPLYEDMVTRFFAPWIIPPGIPIQDGGFEIKGLPEGAYMVSVYVDNGFEVFDNQGSLSAATPVKVRGGEIAEIEMGIPLRDLGPGAIFGRVTDKEGNALQVAVVEAIPMSAETSDRSFPTITAEDGTFALRGLPEDKYIVFARGPFHAAVFYDGVFDLAQASVISVTAEPVEGVDFVLPPIYYAYAGDDRSAAPGSMSIHGTVSDEAGNAVAGALVYVMDDHGNALGYTRTGTDGSYQVNGLNPAGNVHIQVSMPGYLTQFNGGADNLGDAESVEWKAGSSEVNFTLATGQATDTEDPARPQTFRLLGAYPNPFNPSVNIRFELPESSVVRVAVFDLLGREVAMVLDEPLSAGSHTVPFTANGLPSGIYLYRVRAGDGVLTGSMTLMK